jgi:hypothetical protein
MPELKMRLISVRRMTELPDPQHSQMFSDLIRPFSVCILSPLRQAVDFCGQRTVRFVSSSSYSLIDRSHKWSSLREQARI